MKGDGDAGYQSGVVEVENGSDALFRCRFDREKVAPCARHNEDSDPSKILSAAIVGDEALKDPFGRDFQQDSSGSENLAWRSEKNILIAQQTMLETEDSGVVESNDQMLRCPLRQRIYRRLRWARV